MRATQKLFGYKHKRKAAQEARNHCLSTKDCCTGGENKAWRGGCAIQTAIIFPPPTPRAGAGARAQARTALKVMPRGGWREQWKGWQGAHDQMLPMEERLPGEYCLRIPPRQRYGEGPRGRKEEAEPVIFSPGPRLAGPKLHTCPHCLRPLSPLDLVPGPGKRPGQGCQDGEDTRNSSTETV